MYRATPATAAPDRPAGADPAYNASWDCLRVLDRVPARFDGCAASAAGKSAAAIMWNCLRGRAAADEVLPPEGGDATAADLHAATAVCAPVGLFALCEFVLVTEEEEAAGPTAAAAASRPDAGLSRAFARGDRRGMWASLAHILAAEVAEGSTLFPRTWRAVKAVGGPGGPAGALADLPLTAVTTEAHAACAVACLGAVLPPPDDCRPLDFEGLPPPALFAGVSTGPPAAQAYVSASAAVARGTDPVLVAHGPGWTAAQWAALEADLQLPRLVVLRATEG